MIPTLLYGKEIYVILISLYFLIGLDGRFPLVNICGGFVWKLRWRDLWSPTYMQYMQDVLLKNFLNKANELSVFTARLIRVTGILFEHP